MTTLLNPHDAAPGADLQEKLLSSQPEVDPEEVNVLMEDALIGNGGTAGEKQPNQYRDSWAAALFVSHLVAVLYLAVMWGIPALNLEDTSYGATDEVHFAGFFYLCLAASLAALLVAATALSIMTRFAEQLVQISLLFSIGCNALILLFFLTQHFWWGAVLSTVFVAWGLWYARAVWNRIPFAAANLKTAVTALQLNGGIMVVAAATVLVVNLFSVFWMLAWLGVYARSATCKYGECTSHMSSLTVTSFLLSYYWTAAVGKNVLHATVSGVVGTWWFAPNEACSFCSNAITDSWMRASTYSLGSICLGSLLTAVLQVAYHLVDNARRQSRGNEILLCVAECLVAMLERIVAYFNKWAYGTCRGYSRTRELFGYLCLYLHRVSCVSLLLQFILVSMDTTTSLRVKR
jgi:hypothetical protein